MTKNLAAERILEQGMTPQVRRAVRVTARAEEREAVALREYRMIRARRNDFPSTYRWSVACVYRARWSALHDLLASEVTA